MSTGSTLAFEFTDEMIATSKPLGVKDGREFPGTPSACTISRWLTAGVKTRSGRVVRLPYYWVGRTRRTNIHAYVWWIRQFNTQEEAEEADLHRKRNREAAAGRGKPKKAEQVRRANADRPGSHR